MRFCKSCKHLKKVPCVKGGHVISAAHPADDYYYACGWVTTIPVPWPEKSRTVSRANGATYGTMLGKRFVEPELAASNPDNFFTHEDWDELMDCPTWEPKV